MASADRDIAVEKILSANLSRVIDWLKFAEAKNTALLTFCSAWVIAIANFVFNTEDPPREAVLAAACALPLFIAGALLAVVSFAPRTRLRSFSRPGRPAPQRNLLFFGDLRRLSLETAAAELLERYAPPQGRALTDSFVDDVAVQIVVNSRIAHRKFELFDRGAACVIGAFAVMFAVPAVLLLVRSLT